jgi:hypothetical protein
LAIARFAAVAFANVIPVAVYVSLTRLLALGLAIELLIDGIVSCILQEADL